jgi:predicted permease
MQSILQDLTFALRQLRRAPGFAFTAILTLALGIGANTAIFSLLDQALLRALPVHDPSALALLTDTGTAWSGSMSFGGGDQSDYFSYPTYQYLRDHARDFTGLVAVTSTQVGLTRGNTSQFVNTEVVSGNYFNVLGVGPALGRVFTTADDQQPGANPVAILNYDFWQGHLGADPNLVGSTVTINGQPFQIIGVAAKPFHSAIWGQTPGLYLPMSMIYTALPAPGPGVAATRLVEHTYKWLSILGRLKPGVTPAQATADNATLWHAYRADEIHLFTSSSARFVQGFLTDSRLEIKPGARGFSFNRDTLKKPFLAVMAMALLVLLISSVNVASLLMVRSAGRVREFSLRAALGASSGRVLSQLLLEGLLIGIAGGIVGLLLAPAALHVLVGRLMDNAGNTAFTASIDLRLLAFNFVVAIAVSLAFSLVPALQLRKPNLSSTLRESTGTQAGGLLQLRRIVVCLQIGLSVILLVGAGLFIRTMQQLRAVNLGFNTAHLIIFDIDPQLAGYSPAQIPALHQRVLDGLTRIPGVQSVFAGDNEELTTNASMYGVTVSRYQAPPDENYQIQESVVTPNYLAALQVPLIAGRELSETDTLDHPRAAVVNQAFVKHYCTSNDDCLGRTISNGRGTRLSDTMQIVGIVGDFKHRGVREDVVATAFRPLRQVPEAATLFVFLRTAGDPAAMLNQVRSTMQQIEPSLAIGTMHTEDQQIDVDLQNERMITLLATAFGLLATVLAGVGLYGVLAYSTTQRTREIGIRMALGSTRMAVSALIVSDVLRLAAIGLVIALPTAYALSLLLRAQLFGVTAADPLILVSVTALIALVALVAAFLPARRAASINPTAALRTE